MMRGLVIPVILAVLMLFVAPACAADAKDYTKVFIIPFTISEEAITQGDAILQYGYGPNPGPGSGTFRGELTDTKGQSITTFSLWDPRVRIGDNLSMKPDGSVSKITGRFEKVNNAELTLVVPFSKNSGDFILHDTAKGRVSTVNLTPVIRKFCETHTDDPDCGSGMPSLPVLAGIGAVLIIAAGIGWYLLKKKKGTE